jgi:hypothetical protein
MDENALQSQIRAFMSLLLTPMGILGLFLMLVLLVAMMVSPRTKWFALMLMLWTATLSFQVRVGSSVPVTLAFPLDVLQMQSRPICTALLICLLLPALTSSRGWRQMWLGLPVISYFIFEMLMAFRIAAGGISDRGIASMVVFVGLFLALGFGFNRWLQDWRDVRSAVRCIAFTSLMFLVGSVYQLVVNRSAILHGGRLYGTAGNPQHAAIVIAIALPAALYLLVRPGASKIWRVLLAGACGFLITMLVWTGSRTGLLVAAVGVAMFFRARLGKILAVAVTVGLFVFLAINIYSESTSSFTDMFLRGDTRSHVWATMIAQFREHIAWGGMSEEFGISESSYLATAGNMGLFGLIPLIIFLGLAARDLVRLQRVRKHMGEHALLADLVTAQLVAIAIGAMFEGYLLGTLTFPVFCIYINLGIMSFILDAVYVGSMTSDAQRFADSPEYQDEQLDWPHDSGVPVSH